MSAWEGMTKTIACTGGEPLFRPGVIDAEFIPPELRRTVSSAYRSQGHRCVKCSRHTFFVEVLIGSSAGRVAGVHSDADGVQGTPRCISCASIVG